MNIQRKLKIIENRIKRNIQNNEETFEIFNHEILTGIENKTINELSDIINTQLDNIQRYSKANRNLRIELKIIDSLKKYVKE